MSDNNEGSLKPPSPQLTQSQIVDTAVSNPCEARSDPPEAGTALVKGKAKRRKRTKTGKRFKVPNPYSGEHHTFIDDGCKTDSQGYPICPNGETVFVKTAREAITNFGHIVYPHTQKTSGAKDDAPWKTTWYTCLGVLDCDNDTCQYAGPTPTGDGKAAELIMNCRVDVEKDTGWAILRHSGIHSHVWALPKKADPLAMEEMAAEVVKNPKAGPMVLKVGQARAGQNITPSVGEIHPAFAHSGRLGYLRREILKQKGLITEQESKGGGDSFILNIMHWGSEWMAQMLVRRDPDTKKVYSGGLLSDVTYRFFKNGYLLTTSMYSDRMHRWIPVQLTWMAHLDVAHYQGHFTLLMKQMRDAEDITPFECDQLVRQVVDFSSAQKKGFVSAYMDVFNERDPDKAMSKLKGCREHYRQSITRITRNRGVVPAGDEVGFIHFI
ncbi:uncharacterized protein MELLADRAFT_84838 [Melampsora larici-populina 98AG31]|uniref:GCM domain-containing protein n=1 Tax=Melampsora larici-populina (strain 98AG31 / pathotype 3-4-7) TaxID=747676 RepID=F4SCN2_MELLP|nr:uncharacterized protein MELLADRAFT_84838 [Melampsora larici-populina 98AG31]EGF97587.1 hypothetical protein MELLADRAFT_84838 [Melampsora larici-populina 98AG31]